MKIGSMTNLATTTLVASVITIASGVTSPSQAIILTFDMGLGNGNAVDQNYGDNVTSTPNGSFSYGTAGGFTPNVTTAYTTGANFWDTAYGDLTNVIYQNQATGNFALTLTADSGYNVVLNSFDLAGWPNTDYTINSVSVNNGSSDVFSQSSVAIEGDSGHSSFNFGGTPLIASQLIISFDSSNLNTAADNIGIDNVRFSQQASSAAVPFEFSPSLGLLLIGGLFGGKHLYRKHKASKVVFNGEASID
jgi:hypothetical protein